MAGSGSPTSFDEYNSTILHLSRAVYAEIVDALAARRYARAFCLIDSIKSTFFHAYVLSRYANSAKHMMGHPDLKIACFGGWTSEATLDLLNRDDGSRGVISLYILDRRLILMGLGTKGGKPCVSYAPEADKLYSRLEEIYRSWATLVGGSAQSFYGAQSVQANQLLLTLAVCMGELIRLALEPMDKVKDLYIAPHGFLSSLPLHITYTDDTDAFGTFDEVHVIPSWGLVASMADNPFHESVQMLKDRSNRFAGVWDPGLPGTPVEQEYIRGLRSMGLIGCDLDFAPVFIDSLSSRWKSARVLHVSCHGRSSAVSWRDSVMAFPCGEITAADMLASADLSATRLAVLSACQTGLLLDPNTPPDCYCGLDMSFMACGCPRVLSTSWSVDDRAATIFNVLFYYFMCAGSSWPFPKAYRYAIVALREGIWRAIFRETIGIIDKGFWKTGNHDAMKTALCRYLDDPRADYSNVLYWGAFKYMGL